MKKNTLSTSGKGLGLNNQEGFINGVNVLNELCDRLYTTEYGNARCIINDDLLKLAKNDKDKKNKREYSNNNLEITFKSGCFYIADTFKKITEPITIKNDEKYFSFDKGLELEEIIFNGMKGSKGNSIYENNKYFWLADKSIRLYKDERSENLNTVTYGINYFTGYSSFVNQCYVGDNFEGHIDQTHYYGVRPVIEIKDGLNLTKKSENGITTWSI